jgi:hypothetical protein
MHAYVNLSVLWLTESACCHPIVQLTAVDASWKYCRQQHSAAAAAAAHCAAVVALVLRLHAPRPSLYRDATVKARSSCLASLPVYRVERQVHRSEAAFSNWRFVRTTILSPCTYIDEVVVADVPDPCAVCT